MRYRILEMTPGILVWSTFVVAITLSFLRPAWMITFITLFDLYWFLRVIYTLVYLLIAYRRLRMSLKVNWRSVVQSEPGWEQIRHLVIIPTYREPYEILLKSIEALEHAEYPLDRLMVVLACEERDALQAHENARRIQERFGKSFGHLIATFHPDGIPGEIAGKGANIAWAGQQAKQRIDEDDIPYDNVLVTTLDVDSVVHPQYFAHLTSVFLRHPNRLRSSYQPLPLYHNNIWDAPALTRVIATSTTFWLMTETIRPDRLFTFSSHSMPFRALVDVGFWQSDIVTEDSRIFLQCFIQYDGQYEVTPIYIPISMDNVVASSFWRTVVNQYKQQRRWAYGVENFPYMVWNFFPNGAIPFGRKIKYLWNQLEGVFSWATAPVLIFLLGWLPFLVTRYTSPTLLIAQSTPLILNTLMVCAMVGLVAAAALSISMLPPRPERRKSPLWILPMIAQWIMFPVTMILFGSLPATDAQTRLMLGKYLGFWVTEKATGSRG